MKTTTPRRFFKRIPQLLALASLAAFAHTGAAAEPVDLAKYTFTVGAANRLASTANAAHVTATDWTVGAGLLTSERGLSSVASNYYIRGTASNTATTETNARSTGAYLAFNITVDTGWTAALTQFSATLSLDWDNSATSRTSTWQLAVSTSETGTFVNAGAPVSIDTVINTAASSIPVSMTVDLSGTSWASITGSTLYFRLYEWDASNGTSYINRITNVALTGTVTQEAPVIPEISTCVLLLGVVAFLAAFRLRPWSR